MHFVLVHGWGFHAGLWDGFVSHLPEGSVTLVDLGFIAGGSKSASDWPEDAIAVGHSLGLLWLLEQGAERFRALVSIQGFDCFCCHIAPSRVATMRRGLARDPAATLAAFWRACGTSDFAPAEALNVERLDTGLDWLLHWDAQKTKARLGRPVLALAARNDAIVPQAMTQAIWQNAEQAHSVIWSPEGGHVLPLQRPEWCARQTLEFAHAVRP
jgi:pimeloyl-[acyl-carrier protein] methyl ester esterase